jgi:signal transduction histidine kinase
MRSATATQAGSTERFRHSAEGETDEAALALDVLCAQLRGAPEGLTAYDRALRCIHASDAVARDALAPPGRDVHGHTLCEVAPDLALTLEPLLRHVLETDEPLRDLEISAETPAAPGERRHWVVSVYPLRNSVGKTVGVGSLGVDITARKRAEDERAELVVRERSAQQRLTFLAEASQLLASSLDPQVILRRIAHLAVPILGEWCAVYVVEDGRIGPVAHAWADSADEDDVGAPFSAYPGDRADLPPAVAKVLRTGKTLLLNELTAGELEGLLRDPMLRVRTPARGGQSCTVVPLQARGRTLGILSFGARDDRLYRPEDLALAEDLARRCAQAVDNTRLYAQAQRRMHELEALYRVDEALHRSLRLDDVLQALVGIATDILEADKSVVLLWDSKHQRLVVRAAHGIAPEALPLLVFMPGEGISGRAAADGALIVVDDILSDPRVPPQLQPVVKAEAIRSQVSVPIKVSDEVVGVFNAIFTIPRAFNADDQRLVMALAQRAGLAIRNARLYEQAQQALHAHEEFLAATSHELRNPLGNIKGFVSSLQRTDLDWDEPTRRDFLGEIERESDRLEDLVDDLLDLARVDAAGVDAGTRAPAMPKDLVAAGIDRVRWTLVDREVSVSIPDELPTVEVDVVRVEHVVANLVENAVKHTAPKTPIHVLGRVVDDHVEVAVEDEGPGISPEHLERIFDRFFRGRRAESVPGSGLGLAICRAIVQAEGGSIWAENRPSGGARFVFTLPLTRTAELPPVEALTGQRRNSQGGRRPEPARERPRGRSSASLASVRGRRVVMRSRPLEMKLERIGEPRQR